MRYACLTEMNSSEFGLHCKRRIFWTAETQPVWSSLWSYSIAKSPSLARKYL